MSLAAGTRLGHYEILERLGAGGMGTVYRALDTRLRREVALKVLGVDSAGDPGLSRRFEQEALAASALNHPNIVQVHDVGEQDGQAFLVMELVEGRTLRALLSGGPFAVPDILRLGRQVSEGLARAHERGIVHRDLKPENLVVRPDGLVKILDFGLAKLFESGPDPRSDLRSVAKLTTGPGTLLGTFEYMSPEQARCRPVDHRADQFSLGTILYEMATGRFAFRSETPYQTLAAIIEREPEPVTALNPAVPPALAVIITRCLAKSPAGRYASTAELSRELAEAELDARRPGPAPAPRHEPPAPAAPGRPVEAELVSVLPGGLWLVEHEGKVREHEEPELRRKLRKNSYSGLELARRAGDPEWRSLYETSLFREEVPHRGQAQAAARLREVRGTFYHLLAFVLTAYFVTGGAVAPWFLLPWWLYLWGGLLVLGLGRTLVRISRLPGPRRELESPPAPPPTPSPELPGGTATLHTLTLPASLRAELDRVRELLEHRQGRNRAANLADVEHIEATMGRIVATIRDLGEQTAPSEVERLERSAAEARDAGARAPLEQDRELHRRHERVLRDRLDGIRKGRRLLERLRVRLDLAEQQLKQLRLDLTRGEASALEAPELSSRLAGIRFEVDAIEEVDELAPPA